MASFEGTSLLSANGAKCESLGQRPGAAIVGKPPSAEGAKLSWHGLPESIFRNGRAFSAYEHGGNLEPGALPQAFTYRAFGAETPRSTQSQ